MQPINWIRSKVQYKIAFVIFLAVLAASLVNAWHGRNTTLEALKTGANTNLQHAVKTQGQKIAADLKLVSDDLRFLLQVPPIQGLLRAIDNGGIDPNDGSTSELWIERLTTIFRGLLRARPQYIQARYILASGEEVVRVDHKNGTIIVPPKEQRPNQSQTRYFTDTLNLPKDSLYASPLNLSRNAGIIEVPHRPVIRYAVPVFDEANASRGLLIINVSASSFLDELKASVRDGAQQAFLLNTDGYYLAAPDKGKEWGFEFNRDDNFQKDYPENIAQQVLHSESGVITDGGEILAYSRVYPKPGDQSYYWIQVQNIPEKATLAQVRRFQFVAFGIFFGSLLVMVAIGAGLARRWFVKPMHLLTQRVQEIADGRRDLTHGIEVTSRDEVGQLAQAMQKMTHQLNQFSDENKKHQESLQEQTDLLKSILDNMGEGVVVANENGEFILFNPAGEQIVGIGATETSPNEWSERYGNYLPDMKTPYPTEELPLVKAIQGETVDDVEIFLRHALKPEGVWVEVTGRPLKDSAGVSQGGIVVFRDVTQDKKTERELEVQRQALKEQNWSKTGEAELNDKMRGDQQMTTLCRNIITYLAKYLNAQIGAIYLADEESLKMIASYAYTRRKHLANEFKFGEGLVGQAALEKGSILITNAPDNYIAIRSGLGETVPRNILVVPLLYEGEVKGCIELATLSEFTDVQMEFLNQVVENIAIALNSARAREQLRELLEETQQQAIELQAQQEELRQTNEELQEQREELRATNEALEEKTRELEEKAEDLEQQKDQVRQKNDQLQRAQQSLEGKAKDLELASQYKSEFLANMSHELRTPLNSLLILSRLLSDNKAGNLTAKQVEFAQTIHDAGSDLLELINEILDLSKVEAGQMEVHLEDMGLQSFADGMAQTFRPIAEEKGVDFQVELDTELPAHIHTDPQRVQQIVKNLLSNALRFTDEGGVTLHIYRPGTSVDLSISGLDPKKAVAFAVTDTGIGIPKEKQALLFDEFQQADGTTSRKYGGTGLGLSICREFSKLLCGEVQLESEEGRGSTFTLFLPEVPAGSPEVAQVEEKGEGEDPLQLPLGKGERILSDTEVTPIQAEVEDDRAEIQPGDKSILIIEDDERFAKILSELAAEKGFKSLIADDGQTGLHLAESYKPDAIILDIRLPGMDGWAVMERLKDNLETRHIPVHFISAIDQPLDGLKMGAIGYLTKPVSAEMLDEAFQRIEGIVSKTVKKLLVVEDNEAQRKSIIELVSYPDVQTVPASTGQEAYNLLKSGDFDCMILDLGLPDLPGAQLLEKIRNDETISRIPIIVYTGQDLSKQDEDILRKYAESIIIKGAKSPERLLDETTLFLHRVEADLPAEKQQILENLHDQERIFEGKQILLVDDDMRNVFALSPVLKDKGMEVVIGKNGKEALSKLNETPNIDLVLMDIMMPEMDGYEAMREIRKIGKFKNLPIIALTAKAMTGDKQKCIEAGASDYLSKPVDTDRLLSIMRVWLHR